MCNNFADQSIARGAEFLDKKIEGNKTTANVNETAQEQVREDEANKLNVRVGALDKEVQRQETPAMAKTSHFQISNPTQSR